MRLAKAWTDINRLSVIWKSNLSDKIKLNIFQGAFVSILLYGCTTWTLTKRIEKKLDRNCTRMLQVILNTSWKQQLGKIKVEVLLWWTLHNKPTIANPWCNCYRRRKWTRRHEFKPWTRLIAFHIALIPLGKVWIQLFSLQLWVNSRTD